MPLYLVLYLLPFSVLRGDREMDKITLAVLDLPFGAVMSICTLCRRLLNGH